MKITVHEIECNVGYTVLLRRGTDLAKIEAEVADICREDWNGADWSQYQADNPGEPNIPPIPQSDRDVIATYFRAPDDPTADPARCVQTQSFDVELSPPIDTDIDLSVDGPFLARRVGRQARRAVDGLRTLIPVSAVVEGRLIRDGGDISDALEGFILALTAAGFPVHLPEFKSCLAEYCENLDNYTNMDHDVIDYMARTVAEANIRVVRVEEGWWSLDFLDRDHPQMCMPNRHASRAEAVTSAFQFLTAVTIED